MKNKDPLTACLDSNVIISGIAFGGKPLEILERALRREFYLVTGPNILEEVRRNLLKKLDLKAERVERFLKDLADVASVYVPHGELDIVKSKADNLVLEVAQLGESDVLVTGDRRHLLPLNSFGGFVIEPPSKFLLRFDF